MNHVIVKDNAGCQLHTHGMLVLLVSRKHWLNHVSISDTQPGLQDTAACLYISILVKQVGVLLGFARRCSFFANCNL